MTVSAMVTNLFENGGSDNISKLPMQRGNQMKNEMKLSAELDNDIQLFSQSVEMEGGDAEIVEIRQNDKLLARYCSCNGVRKNCPAPQSPHCDCTTNPPSLTCV
jgi:hypothetical protein